MRRSELAHILRAASRIVPDEELLVIGSQAILGSMSEDRLPDIAILSREADLAFWDDLDNVKSDRVDGAIGELSQFDATFGYYGQGVSVTTAVLPRGWRDRLVRFAHPDAGESVVWCLERHDLALSKLVAHRPKDRAFVDALIDAELLALPLLIQRCDELPVESIHRRTIRRWLDSRSRRASSP